MNYFAPIFQGDERADMDDPSCILCVLEFPIDNSGSRWFFGRQVAPFGRLCRQPENPRVCLALTNRPVLGPTTLDNDLAFLMTNVAEISDHKTQLVFDPFCGTAGLLLTATERGARTMGGELDFRVLYGWMCTYAKGGQERTDVALNFEHYGFARPEFVICDNAQPPWRANSGICDAVLTDTPYGVRAATKCTRTREEDEARGALQSRLVQYADEPLLLDLVNRAGEMLKTGGVLVFLMHLDLIDLLDESEIAEIEQKETKRMFIRNRPGDGRKTLYVSEASRLPALLDMERYKRLIPEGGRAKLRLESAGLQILTAGTGRLLVKMRKMEEIVS
jgi:tRNA (guanine10-N2)-methyltransferase